MSEKQKLLNFIANLEDSLSMQDILTEILVYCKVKESLDNITNDNTITNEEMKELILKC